MLVWRLAVLSLMVLPVGLPRHVAAETLARVNGEAVLRDEVQREMARAVGRRKLDAAARERIAAETLERVIDRRLVAAWLNGTGRGATAAEIDQHAARIKRNLTEQKRDFNAWLRDQKLAEDEWRRETAWRLAWSRYVDDQLPESELQKYFERRRRDFDGTQVRVRHVLLKPDTPGDQGQVKQLVSRAAALREEIVAGKLSFDQAARLHSASPTRGRGGDLGFISRHADQSEAFSRAAFALPAGAISPPVVTPHGVHLIQCVEIKPGTSTLDDVRDDIRAAAAAELFRKVAANERKAARIEYVRSQ